MSKKGMRNVLLISLVIVMAMSLTSAFDFSENSYSLEWTGNLTNLSEMQDTDTAGATNGQALVWVSATGKWTSTTIEGLSDTNETTRFNNLVNNDCGSGYLVIGVQSNGTVLCALDNTGSATTDTNASTACGDGEFLNGDGTCDAGFLDADGVDDTGTDDQTCAEVSGCVESAITDGNTNWDNSYGFITWAEVVNGTMATVSWVNTQLANYVQTSSLVSLVGNFSAWDKDYNDLINKPSMTDTNASTACGDGEFLNGDGTCDAGFLDADGTDDDNPEEGDVLWSDLTDDGTFTDTKYCTYSSGTGYINCNSEGGGTDTNETIRMNNLVNGNCTEGNFVEGHLADGTPVCDAPAGSGDITAVYTNGDYLTGGGASGDISLLINMTKMNETMDARDDTGTDDQTCAEVSGCVEGAITDGNTGWDNSYGFITNSTMNKTTSWTDIIGIPSGFADGIDNDSGGTSYTHLSNFTDDIGVNSDWDEIGDLPTATPSNGDTTHVSTADQIYDWVISLAYATQSWVNSQGFFTSEDNITCTAISGLSADLCDGADANTQLSQENVQDYAGAMAGTHLTYTDGSNDLSVDDDWVDIGGDTMTGNINMNGNNITNSDHMTLCNGANCWKIYVNASDYLIIEEV